jgi:ascorbate-specific PTS system EIIC-type component UlaA
MRLNMKINYKVSFLKDSIITIFIIVIIYLASNIFLISKDLDLGYDKLQEMNTNFNISAKQYQKCDLVSQKYNIEDGIVAIYEPVPMITNEYC